MIDHLHVFEQVSLDCFFKVLHQFQHFISVGILIQSLGPYTLSECTANTFYLT